jgi:hypothetical protein
LVGLKIELNENTYEKLKKYALRKKAGCEWVLQNKNMGKKARERLLNALQFWNDILSSLEKGEEE